MSTDLVWVTGDQATTFHTVVPGSRYTGCGKPVGDVVDGRPARGRLVPRAAVAGLVDCGLCFGRTADKATSRHLDPEYASLRPGEWPAEDLARTVECPNCGVQPGVRCVSNDRGKDDLRLQMASSHLGRLLKARGETP